jgi:hypothetical protein
MLTTLPLTSAPQLQPHSCAEYVGIVMSCGLKKERQGQPKYSIVCKREGQWQKVTTDMRSRKREKRREKRSAPKPPAALF